MVLADVVTVGDTAPALPQPATLRSADQQDRYGRIVGDLWLGAGDTLSSMSLELLRSGLALVDPAVMPMTCLEAAFDAEREAEAEARGLWSDPPLASATNPRLDAEAGAYRLVEGRIISTGETQRTIYLNFGRDYRTDFTVLVAKSDAKGWDVDLQALEGRRVRVRGVVEAWNGAMIRVEHPGQIERR